MSKSFRKNQAKNERFPFVIGIHIVAVAQESLNKKRQNKQYTKNVANEMKNTIIKDPLLGM